MSGRGRRHIGGVRVVNGEYNKDSANLMKFMAKLIEPVLQAKDIYLKTLFELDWNNPNQVPGVNTRDVYGLYSHSSYSTRPGILGFHLRNPWQGKKWQDYNDLVGTLCHELGHVLCHQKRGDRENDHGPEFYRCALEIQETYYRIYSRVRDPLRKFCPDGDTIRRMHRSSIQDEITRSIGMPTPSTKNGTTRNDWVIEVRQWCIERKLDSEAAKKQGKKLSHYNHGNRGGSLLMDIKDRHTFGDTLRSMFKGIFSSGPGPSSFALSTSSLSSSSAKHTDKDGYMGLKSHPKHKKFLKDTLKDMKKGRGSLADHCSCKALAKGKSPEIRGNMCKVDF